jgi:hypothetical protein
LNIQAKLLKPIFKELPYKLFPDKALPDPIFLSFALFLTQQAILSILRYLENLILQI